MKVLAINGSPRKGWNTQTLVKKALDGAADAGAYTELINLYEHPIKGCLECYACKRKGNKTDGLCAIRDEMRPLLEKAHEADVIILGAPNFFGYPSGLFLAFLERFLFPITSYQIEDGKSVRVLGDRIVPAGLIYTMNSDEEYYKNGPYKISMGHVRDSLEVLLGYVEQYNSYATLQFKDYTVMDANVFDSAYRQQRHETQFPIDEQKCYEMGKRLVEKAREANAAPQSLKQQTDTF